MPLAIMYARNHFTSDSRFDFDERRSVAFLALCKAAKNFDEARGYSFGTYAGRVIWSELRRGAYKAASQMTRPSIGTPRPELESQQQTLGAYAETMHSSNEIELQENRDYVAWILEQLDEQQQTVARGIMEGKSYEEIKLPRIKGRGKTSRSRVAYVKKRMDEAILKHEFNTILEFIHRRMNDADLRGTETDEIQGSGRCDCVSGWADADDSSCCP
jgi:RNA polymerase sigma factor (sigma-70 family)